MLLALVSLTFAQDAEVFIGGGVQGRGGLDLSDAGGFAGNAEAEVNVAGSAGGLVFRADIDATMDYAPAFGFQDPPPDFGVNEIARPEWLMIGYNGGSWESRGGIINAGFGLEDWDDWALYLPQHGQYFAVSPGRMAGSEFQWFFNDGDGPMLAVGGGYDLDYEAAIIEANVTVETDSFATWSGVAVYPEPDYEIYEAILGAEYYPADFLTVAVGGMGGMAYGSPFATGTVYGVFIPEAMVNPVLCVEGSFDPDGAQGLAPWAIRAGAGVVPLDFLKILVEGNMTGVPGGDPLPGVAFSVNVFRPEPEEEEE
ncbi:MAG: hypothetical protein FJ090_07835 [Deltaproteobacteria bacterium]|nr:hypothetical protein [Deltaproteobacteria bacterium]